MQIYQSAWGGLGDESSRVNDEKGMGGRQTLRSIELLWGHRVKVTENMVALTKIRTGARTRVSNGVIESGILSFRQTEVTGN